MEMRHVTPKSAQMVQYIQNAAMTEGVCQNERNDDTSVWLTDVKKFVQRGRIEQPKSAILGAP